MARFCKNMHRPYQASDVFLERIFQRLAFSHRLLYTCQTEIRLFNFMENLEKPGKTRSVKPISLIIKALIYFDHFNFLLPFRFR